MSVEVADLYVTLRSISDPFSKGLKSAASDAESSSKRMTSALASVAKVGVGVAVGLTGIAVESVRMASTFNAQMTLLQTQAGVSKTQIASLSSGVLSLAGQVGFSPTSLAEALFHVESSFASVGITGPQAMNILKIAAEGAAVGHANLVDVTNALDSAVVSGIPGVQNMSSAMGVLNATVGAGDMTMQDLANAFSTGLLATVKGFGLSITDVGAALAVFGDNNIRGTVAATDLRMAVMAMAKPAASSGDELRKLGLSSDTLAKDMQSGGLLKALEDLKKHMDAAGVSAVQQGQVITDLFGKKAGTGMNVLIDQLDRVKSKYPDLEKGATGFADAWTATKATFAQQMKEIRAEGDATAVRLGNFLLPQLGKLLSGGQSGLSQVVSGFSGSALKPVAHDNLRNAFLNQDVARPPELTGWQKFGAEVHRVLADIVQGLVKLKPVGQDFVRFGQDAWQALQKLAVALGPTAKLLGEGFLLAVVGVGKALANVAGPALKNFADFLSNHQGMIKFFAEVIIGGLIVKMTILGTLNAAQGILGLATAITQFPLGQAGQIGDALKALKTAYTGKDAAEGEAAIGGLKGAFNDLKTSAGNLLDKFSLFGGSKAAGIGKLGEDMAGVEQVAAKAPEQLGLFETSAAGIVQVAKTEQLGLFETSMTGIVQVAEKSPEALAAFATGEAGIATGAKAAAAETEAAGVAAAGMGTKMLAVLGPIGLLAGALVGIGYAAQKTGMLADHTGQAADKDMQQLGASAGMAQAAIDKFGKYGAALAIISGESAGGAGGVQEVDKALAGMVTSGHADWAKARFDAIAASLKDDGMSSIDAASKFPTYEAAVKGAGDAAQGADAQISGLQTALGKQQALTQFQGDLSSLTQAVRDNGKSLFDNTDMARANQQAMQMAAGQIEGFYTQQRNAGVPINQATADLQQQVDQLERTGIQAGLTKSDVDKYLGTLGLIPSSIGTTITANIGPAMQQLGTLIEKIDNSTGVVQITGTGGGMYAGGRAYTNADGGPVRKGQLSWVGERGPELVVFGHDGYVVPNEALTGRRPLDSRVLSGAGAPGVGSAGYVSGFASGGASVVNNYYVTNHVAGTVLSQIELDALVRKLVQQHKTRNSTTGMN